MFTGRQVFEGEEAIVMRWVSRLTTLGTAMRAYRRSGLD
jgi:hypothetical protein